MELHYAPNAECPDCAPMGNRFMTHIRTHPGRSADPATDDALRVLVYQCIKCRRLRSETYDATSASRRALRQHLPQERAS